MRTNETQSEQSPPAVKRVAKIVQLTDCHLGPTDEYCLAGVRTFNSFREVLNRVVDTAVRTGDKPDLIMVTGDVSAHGSEEAYRRFTRVMEEVGLPYAWLPGNHDDFSLMLDGLSVSPYCPVIEEGNWRLASLNTSVPGRVEGALAESELKFLEQALAVEQDSHIALFMHHPPMNVGCDWLDRQQVANGSALGELLQRHSNVRAIFTGHVHQNSQQIFYGVPLHTTPSTCFQFAPQQKDFALDTQPPGFRWIELFDNGDITTEVVWIEDTLEIVDTDVHGY